MEIRVDNQRVDQADLNQVGSLADSAGDRLVGVTWAWVAAALKAELRSRRRSCGGGGILQSKTLLLEDAPRSAVAIQTRG